MSRFLSLFVVVCLAPACAVVLESRPSASKIAPADLVGHWVHSREEDTPGRPGWTFRPAGSRAFPPSRFRMQYVFEAGGACDWYYLAPNDGHHFREGRWRLASDTLAVEQGEETVTYRVLEHGPDVLRLQPLSN